jgi:hypothetical protein
MFSTGANTRITIKTAGAYLFTIGATFASSATGVNRIVILSKNTVEIMTAAFPAGSALTTRASASFCDVSAVTDYYELKIYQDAGTLNTTDHFFSAFLIGSTT